MLLDDRNIALNDIIVLCEEIADEYLDAAELIGDPELSRMFRELAQQRERIAAELSQHILDLGALPRVPDTEKEMLERLVLRMKATLSADERLALIEERMQAETEIGRLVDHTLQANLPEPTRAVLYRLRDEAMDARARLSAKAGVAS